jgi:hypothetical protein
MKRDKALMGEILKQLASFGTLYGDVEKIQSALPGQVAPEVILHHLRLLYDRGLAAVDMHNFWRVTDQGYDALETGGELFGKQGSAAARSTWHRQLVFRSMSIQATPSPSPVTSLPPARPLTPTSGASAWCWTPTSAWTCSSSAIRAGGAAGGAGTRHRGGLHP